jgi:hypothetical protein
MLSIPVIVLSFGWLRSSLCWKKRSGSRADYLAAVENFAAIHFAQAGTNFPCPMFDGPTPALRRLRCAERR